MTARNLRTAAPVDQTVTNLTVQSHPRVGGIRDQGTVWTGGSNLLEYQPNTVPSSPDQHRPSDVKLSVLIKDKAKKGMQDSDKLALPMENNGPSITTWLMQIKDHMREHGMDTVFMMCDYSTRQEWDLLTDWGMCEYRDTCLQWEHQLLTGVPAANGTI